MQTEVQIEANSTPRTLGSSILERIGNTPLLRLDRLTDHLPGITLLGKAEWANPGGSVKDRAASAIVAAAEVTGEVNCGLGALVSIEHLAAFG